MSFSKSLLESIRDLKTGIQSSLTEHDIYVSREMSRYLSDLRETMFGRKCGIRKITVVADGADGMTAFTDGSSVTINYQHHLISRFTDPEARFIAFLGMVMHECAHSIYLDFSEEALALRYIEAGHLYGKVPTSLTPDEAKALDEIREAMDNPATRGIFEKVLARLSNTISDQHDENALISEYGPFARACIHSTRKSLMSTFLPYEDAVDTASNPLTVMFNLILQMCRTGYVVYRNGDDLEHPEFKTVLEYLSPHLDAACTTDDISVKYGEMIYFLIALWPFIREMLEPENPPPETNDKSESGSEKSNCNDSGNGNGGDEENQQSEHSPSQQAENDCGNNSHETDDAKGAAGQSQSTNPGSAGYGSHGMEDFSNNGGTGLENAVSHIMDALAQADNGNLSPQPENCRSSATAINNRVYARNTSSGQREPTETNDNTTGGTEDDFCEESGDGMSEAATFALSCIASSIAENQAESRVEDIRSAELNTVIHTANACSSHKDFPLEVTRIKDVSSADRENYERRWSILRPYANRLKKQLEDALRDLVEGSETRHRPYGKTFDIRDVYREDQLFFTNRKSPDDLPAMAILLLIDQSGSMAGDRLDAAIDAAILLNDFCEYLHIPLCVAGHTEIYGQQMNYTVYTDFDNGGKNEKYRLVKLSPCECNRDGMAINISNHLLQSRGEEIKLLISVTDGQPNGYDYGSTLAEQDCRNMATECNRNGISFIAAGIGSDRDRVKDIYRDDYVDVSVLSELGPTLATLVKSKILHAINR